jgi:hypothetical protein
MVLQRIPNAMLRDNWYIDTAQAPVGAVKISPSSNYTINPDNLKSG